MSSPDSMDPESLQRLRDVRTEVWSGGAQGLLWGLGAGLLGHWAAIRLRHPSLKLNRNTLVATVLISGSLGSFLGAVVRGKNSIQYIGDVFRARPNARTSSYAAQQSDNEQQILDGLDEAAARREAAISTARAQAQKSSQNKARLLSPFTEQPFP
eukprot:CAMPEP_0173333320 /NCGR_PEP_ID=MMETSP1144-20121109/4810_1 /TAXON_ID=483371 /ORGANISM="non described non described, Strain CCMP2298" /LENGTH=154 /DNA_ID=CAMNT_0014278237 /DNA_START=45 /DNA_END=506 /DNA_ORIENTATION=-